ncbi:hypothetical protein WG906_16005 [Pedobacter sp. P351]|uniref:hypothetical protein n=1 Tax=Pedobacter superstes TaxID=3133441 RepID=UPI003099B59B
MKVFSLALLIPFLCAGNSFCQSADTTKILSEKREQKYNPAISLENPVGGGQFGEVVFGFSYQNKTRISYKDDASAAVYVGLGDPVKFIGGGMNVNIFGLTNKFGEQDNIMEGGIDLHLNKFLLHERLLLDVGVLNPFVWGGNSYISYQKSWYVSGNYMFNTKSPRLFSYFSVTGGLGNGNFRKDSTYNESGSGSFEPFLSLATPILKNLNIILEWNGYDLAAGLSVLPSQRAPFMLTCEITDINYGNPRMVASLSYPVCFGKSAKTTFRNVKNIRPVRTIGIK